MICFALIIMAGGEINSGDGLRIDDDVTQGYTVRQRSVAPRGCQMAVVSEELMAILRCPVAVHYTDKGDDPGQLRIVRDSWLVCDDSGYKYPIRDGIPVMLVDEGEKWKDTVEADLPVPPPEE